MKEHHRDWLVAILFMFAMILASGRLILTGWTDDLMLVQGAAILGTILGLSLAVSRFQARARHWLAAAYTLFVLPWLLLGMASSAEMLQMRLLSLGGRISFNLTRLVSAEEVTDPLLFITFACLVFWFIGIFCGQAILQPGRLLAGLMPPSLVTLLIQLFDGYLLGRIWIVSVYLALVLLLIGRKNYLDNDNQWRVKGIFTGSEPEFDLNRSIIIATILIVFLAWTLPTPTNALSTTTRWLYTDNEIIKSMQERIRKALAALTSEQPPLERYGETLSLGSQADQGDGLLFRVRTPATANLPRYYWRARIYDTYENGQWQNTTSLASRAFLPEGPDLNIPESDGRLAEFEFEWFFASQATLVTHPQPVWVSRPVQLFYTSLPENLSDVSGWRAVPALMRGERYLARSVVKNSTIFDLQQAGEEYPDWVLERYLDLPDDISARIVTLAVSISADAPTPYDKTEQITTYLRENIIYDERVPWIPPGTDALERFLFDWQRGYCNYYASAQVIMLRAVGIPARLAVGYAQGERSNGNYIVRAKDAHAWPEVYFPGIGWVEFEPTGNQTPLVRPSGIPLGPRLEQVPVDMERELPQFKDEPFLSPPASSPEPVSLSQFPYQTIFVWIIITLLVIFGGYTLWRLNRQQPFGQRALQASLAYYRWRGVNVPNWLDAWQRWSTLTDVERAFHAINQALTWFRQEQPESLTPAERVQLLQKLLPQAAKDISTLATEHEMTLYSAYPGDPARAKKAAWNIRISLLRSVFD